MSGNILQAEHVSESSDLSRFFISAEYQLTIITTYRGWELWNSILWGNTQCSPHYLRTKTCSHIWSRRFCHQHFPWKCEGQLVLLTVYTAEYYLLLTFFTLWEQTAEKMQNSWPTNASERKRMGISLCFILPCAKIWREQGLSQCLIS